MFNSSMPHGILIMLRCASTVTRPAISRVSAPRSGMKTAAAAVAAEVTG